MNTLKQLYSGELKGASKVKISENLTHFPMEIIDLADTLEVLDLSNNSLTSLPKEISKLKNLKIAFFSNNLFSHVPDVFKECENLYMIGFKSNQIEIFEEDILPLSVSWLILTDNKLKLLPNSIGNLAKLQKCALAGNRLTSLPKSMSNCKNLELIRLSANNLTKIPNWLLELPKLSWLAFSGNPCSIASEAPFKEMEYESIIFDKMLGEGASGEIYKGYAKSIKQDVAIKLFKADITSDGYAKDEMNAYLSIETHPNLIQVISKINSKDKIGLVLELIPSTYTNLGLPPSLESCTRDTFHIGQKLSIETIYDIIESIAHASEHLHKKSLMHGDLYAHNILINNENNHLYFGDFGAATFYDKSSKQFERIETRALGCLIDDLLNLCEDNSHEKYALLEDIKKKCMNEEVSKRPLFSEILQLL